MKNKVVYGIMLTLLLMGMLSISLSQLTVAEASPLTVLSVDPTSIVDPTLVPSSIFRINITVADVQKLWGYQFILSYNTSILSAMRYGFYPPFEYPLPSGINDVEGYVALARGTFMGDWYGLTTIDPAPIAWIEFIVDNIGTSVLDLHNSILASVYAERIPHEDVDGFFDNRLPVVTATVDIDPDTLNLKSRGKWITAYIQLPEGYDVSDIDISTVMLNGIIGAELHPTEIGDYDADGIPDLMVKFDRATVETFIYNQGTRYGNVALTITGELFDGTPFEGTDIIFVNYAGDANNDGIVNILDAGMVSAHWYPGPPIGQLGYDSNAELNKDGTVNIGDVGILSLNWGQTVP